MHEERYRESGRKIQIVKETEAETQGIHPRHSQEQGGSRHPGWALQRTTPQAVCAQTWESVTSRVPSHPAPAGLRSGVSHCPSLAVYPGSVPHFSVPQFFPLSNGFAKRTG